MKNAKPEPIVTSTVCSLCGLDWDAHGDKPTALKCIELLRAELAKPRGYTAGGFVRNPTTFIVGERGPERIGLGSGATITQHVATSGNTTSATIASSVVDAIQRFERVNPRRDEPPDMGVPAKVG